MTTNRLLLVLFLFMFSVIGTLAETELPDNSIYHLESSWRDQQGQYFDITELQGSIRLVAFVYTYCEHTCPIIITQIKSILNELPEYARERTIVTLVTLDPERDTVERVREYMKEKYLEDDGWQILVGSPEYVLSLAALFDVRYKPMGESDIAHSNVITLLDQNGVIHEQIKGLRQSNSNLISHLTKLVEE